MRDRRRSTRRLASVRRGLLAQPGVHARLLKRPARQRVNDVAPIQPRLRAAAQRLHGERQEAVLAQNEALTNELSAIIRNYPIHLN